jgi:hypothetical protein
MHPPDPRQWAVGPKKQPQCLSRLFPETQKSRIDKSYMKHLDAVVDALLQESQRKKQARIAATELWSELLQVTGGDVAKSVAYLVVRYRPSTVLTYLKRIVTLFPELKMMAIMQQMMHRVHTQANVTPKACATPATPAIVTTLIRDLFMSPSPHKILVFQMWASASRFVDLQQTEVDWFPEHQAVRLHFTVPNKSDPTGYRRIAKWIPCSGEAEALFLWKRQKVSYESMLKWLHESACPTMTCHSFRHGAIRFLLRDHYETDITALTGHAVPNQPKGILPYCCPMPTTARAKVSMAMAKQLIMSVKNGMLTGQAPSATRKRRKEVTFAVV